MRLMGLYRGASLLFLFALLITFGVHGVLRDGLLFQSDLLSLSLYLIAASLTVFALLVPAWIMARWLTPRLGPLLYRAGLYAAAILVTTMFAVFGLILLGAHFDLGFVEDLYERAHLLAGFTAAAAIISGWTLWAQRDREISLARVERLALGMLGAALIAGPVLFALVNWTGGQDRTGGPGRHVVLLVLDGMPAQHLQTYNEAASRTVLDDLAANGRTFLNMRTSAAWTNAFFGVLYSGEAAASFERERARKDGRNLMGALQQAGVAVRWIAFHQNGIPEGSAAQVTSYGGLRSKFLSDRFSWIPRALGLDYHLVLPTTAMDGLFLGDLDRRLFHWLNIGPERDNLFTEILLPEVHQIQGTARRTVTVFHLGWQAAIGADRPPAAWEADRPMDEVGRADAHARANDYRYEPQHEWIAEVHRGQAAAAMQILSGRINAFMEALAAERLADDTLVIVTADHGSANTKGRFWYGFHPIEEVMRVPFMLIGDVAPGLDERVLSTIDLPQGILDYFGAGTRLNDEAVSFYSERRREFSAGATLRSDINREWFLLLYGRGRKYRINLHPDGDGTVAEFRLDGFEEELVAEYPEPPAEIVAPVGESIQALGFPGGEVHHQYRELVAP